MRYILLFSGGVDSTTALYFLKAQGHEVRALAINYGQRHFRELEAARMIAEKTDTPIHFLDLGSVRELISNSSQTGELEVPEGHYTEDSMKQTVVPNRNMIMLSMAMGWAINLKFDGVAYAAHAGDHTIYPDCRPEFIKAMRRAGHLCDWHSLETLAPFSEFSKAQIVKIGSELQVPFHLTWSCYKGELRHCGRCGTCVERKEAFREAHVFDPTAYQDEILHRQQLIS